MNKQLFYISTSCIYLGFLFLLLISLQSCKNEKTKTTYVKNKYVINYGDNGITNKKAVKFFNEGLKNVENRDFYTAEEFFQKADSIEKDNTIILNSLALMSEKFSNYDEAQLIYNKIFSKDSISIITYVNYGRFLLSQQKFKEANQILLIGHHFAENSNNGIEPQLLFNLSISFFYLKDCENAMKFMKMSKDFAEDEVYRGQIEEAISEMRTKCH